MTITQEPGIYKITNKVNGHFYIGSAVKLSYRWSNHKSYLNKGKHANRMLQNAWNKYGENGFDFEVLEIVENLDNLIATEQKWLDETNAAERRDAYNILPKAHSAYRHPKPCANCQTLAKNTRRGCCHACNEYIRRNGIERPYATDGRKEKSAENNTRLCDGCKRLVTVAGYAAKGLCKSCYRTKDRVKANRFEPKPCSNCEKLAKPLRYGRCHACAEYFRRRGVERHKFNRRRSRAAETGQLWLGDLEHRFEQIHQNVA